MKREATIVRLTTDTTRKVNIVRVLKKSIEIEFTTSTGTHLEKWYNKKDTPNTYYNYDGWEIIRFDRNETKQQEERDPVAWVITTDTIEKGENVGSCSDSIGWTPENIKKATHKKTFRLLDDDDIIYFYGVIAFNSEELMSTEIEFNPLDDFGSAFGCTSIQYKENGIYTTL